MGRTSCLALRPERELSSASVAELSLVALSSNVAVAVSEARRHRGGSGLTVDGGTSVGASSAREGADMAVLCGVAVRIAQRSLAHAHRGERGTALRYW